MAEAVIIAVGITASFLSSASTARLDQKPHTYVGVGAATTSNYVEIDARVGQITPSQSQVSVRVDVVPHGTYATNIYALARALTSRSPGWSVVMSATWRASSRSRSTRRWSCWAT